MEQWTEGTRPQRMKLDKAPWSWNKLRRKGSKQFLWVTFSLWTGFTFVGYFVPVRELGPELLTFSAGGWVIFWTLFYGFATYGNAGYMREQVCKYMCPYARFQSAMFDKDTLIISYDEKRGEPRGSRKRGVDPQKLELGHCIDCTLCVQVCPTGIDIREGLQYECIACAACIDACDSVMDKMDYPRGLVRYSTEHAMKKARPGSCAARLRVRRVVAGPDGRARDLDGDAHTDHSRRHSRPQFPLPGVAGRRDREHLYAQGRQPAQRFTAFRLTVEGVPGIELDGVSEVIAVDGGGVCRSRCAPRARGQRLWHHGHFVYRDGRGRSVRLDDRGQPLPGPDALSSNS